MKKLRTRLKIDGKTKWFTAPKGLSLEVCKLATEIEKCFKQSKSPEVIAKKVYPFICEMFGNQFTVSQLKKGMDERDLLPLAQNSILYFNSILDEITKMINSRDAL